MEAYLVRVTRNHMATTFDLTASVSPDRRSFANRVLLAAHEEIARLESELTEFRPQSPVARLNSAGAGVPVQLTPDGIRLLESSMELRRRTEGAFDCTAKTPGHVPLEERLTWEAASGLVTKHHRDVHLGFGAIGKGYALDRVRDLLEREGLCDFLLVAGGSSILMSGFAAPGQPWTWGWSWERDADGESLGIPFSHASGKGIALGISGLHEKGLHILDPRAAAAVTGPRSALVAHTSAASADALSTALFVSGWERGFELMAEPASEPAVAMIDSDQAPRWNGVFQRLWGAPAAAALMTAAAVLLPLAARAEEESIDLSALGTSDFTPYMVERNSAWILLPLLMIGMILLHLRKPPRKQRKIQTPSTPHPKGEPS